jgi:hypothetical protein
MANPFPMLPPPPPAGGKPDWQSWARWGVTVALILAAMYFGQGKAEQVQGEVKEMKAEMKALGK